MDRRRSVETFKIIALGQSTRTLTTKSYPRYNEQARKLQNPVAVMRSVEAVLDRVGNSGTTTSFAALDESATTLSTTTIDGGWANLAVISPFSNRDTTAETTDSPPVTFVTSTASEGASGPPTPVAGAANITAAIGPSASRHTVTSSSASVTGPGTVPFLPVDRQAGMPRAATNKSVWDAAKTPQAAGSKAISSGDGGVPKFSGLAGPMVHGTSSSPSVGQVASTTLSWPPTPPPVSPSDDERSVTSPVAAMTLTGPVLTAIIEPGAANISKEDVKPAKKIPWGGVDPVVSLSGSRETENFIATKSVIKAGWEAVNTRAPSKMKGDGNGEASKMSGPAGQAVSTSPSHDQAFGPEWEKVKNPTGKRASSAAVSDLARKLTFTSPVSKVTATSPFPESSKARKSGVGTCALAVKFAPARGTNSAANKSVVWGAGKTRQAVASKAISNGDGGVPKISGPAGPMVDGTSSSPSGLLRRFPFPFLITHESEKWREAAKHASVFLKGENALFPNDTAYGDHLAEKFMKLFDAVSDDQAAALMDALNSFSDAKCTVWQNQGKVPQAHGNLLDQVKDTLAPASSSIDALIGDIDQAASISRRNGIRTGRKDPVPTLCEIVHRFPLVQECYYGSLSPNQRATLEDSFDSYMTAKHDDEKFRKENRVAFFRLRRLVSSLSPS